LNCCPYVQRAHIATSVSMGCGGSKAAEPAPAPAAAPVEGQMIAQVAPSAGAPTPHKSGGGKGKGKGKGKGAGASHWQIKLDGNFKDYGKEEDAILKRAYMTGQKNAKFHLRGQSYEYNFKKMIQKNNDTKKERQIRPPNKGPKPPKKPLLPGGPMIIITVGSGQPGTMIEVQDPNNPGKKVQVFVPAHAKAGQKMAVPIPGKGEDVASVQAKQKKHDDDLGLKSSPWSTGGKAAAGAAGVAGLAAVGVGGVILGDHLAGGEMASTVGEAAAGAFDDAGDWAADAVPDAADAAGDWAEGAAGDAGEWLEGAGEDIAEFAVDAGDWLGDAGEDIGDFVMDLF